MNNEQDFTQIAALTREYPEFAARIVVSLLPAKVLFQYMTGQDIVEGLQERLHETPYLRERLKDTMFQEV